MRLAWTATRLPPTPVRKQTQDMINYIGASDSSTMHPEIPPILVFSRRLAQSEADHHNFLWEDLHYFIGGTSNFYCGSSMVKCNTVSVMDRIHG